MHNMLDRLFALIAFIPIVNKSLAKESSPRYILEAVENIE